MIFISTKHKTSGKPAAVTFICLMVLFLTSTPAITAQLASDSPDELDLVPIIIPDGTTYLSRYNLRIYENNSYRGLRYVEISGQLRRSEGNRYESSFWQISETTRDLRAVVAGIDRSDRRVFTLDELLYQPASGSYPAHLYSFPEYRNFPVLPAATLYRLEGPGIPEEGFSYEAPAYRLVDPEGDGRFSPVSVYVRYIYRGTGEYLGATVHFFDADFALRSDGRQTGFAVQGRNMLRISVFPGDETRILMNNSITEQYGLTGGRQIRLEGFGLTWIRSPRPVYDDPVFLRGIASSASASVSRTQDSSEPAPGPALATTSGQSGETAADATPANPPAVDPPPAAAPATPGTTPAAAPVAPGDQAPRLPPQVPERISSESGDIELSASSLGLSLNLPNLQFRPDSAELLPGEMARMDVLVDLLRQAGERRFLVVGHTADVGNPTGQQNLSVERARTVAQMLADRGLPPGTIRFEGRGAREPLGDNATAQGRARNRRVEIIILN